MTFNDRKSLDELVESTLSESGVPVIRGQWGSNPPDVWAVYVATPIQAHSDNATANIGRSYTATLYQDFFSEQVADRFEEAVAALGPYSREDEWSNAHDCVACVFRFTVANHE